MLRSNCKQALDNIRAYIVLTLTILDLRKPPIIKPLAALLWRLAAMRKPGSGTRAALKCSGIGRKDSPRLLIPCTIIMCLLLTCWLTG